MLHNSYYYEEPRVVKFIEIESILVVVEGWGNEIAV